MKENRPTYSELMRDISNGKVESLILITERREVLVIYNDGRRIVAPILRDDQNIIQIAKESKTALTVKDFRSEQVIASTIGTLGFILIIFIGLSFIIRRTTQAANSALGFGKSNARDKPLNDIDIRFDDVAGIAEAADEMQEVVSFLLRPDALIKLGAKTPKGILLVGPPGTGKTLLAKAIAGEAGVPFFSLAASEFVELFVGVGASRVRDLFRKAKKKAPCIIFIDELDAIGRQRGTGIGGGNDEREQTLNQLLTEMDGFEDNSGIILLAATNRADVLDSALTRPGRFDRRIFIDLPNRKGREQILSVHARSKPIAEDVSLKELSTLTPGFSGADLANLLNEAAILTARDNENVISAYQVDRALEKITIGLNTPPLLDGSKKRLIAYHEIGHALLSCLLPDSDTLDKVTILPRGKYGGFTRFRLDDEVLDSGLITKNYLQTKLIISLGGRAAECIVFGDLEVTQGASGDFEQVTEIARSMVTEYGFSTLGPISLSDEQSSLFLGRNLIRGKKELAQKTSMAIDLEVRNLAIKALNSAIKILSPYRLLMDKLVELLLDEETISGDRFNKFLKEYKV